MNIANGSLAEALSNTIMLYVTHGSGWCLRSHRRWQRITKLLARARASQRLVLGGLRWACGHRWSRHAGHGWVGLTHLKLGQRGEIVQIAHTCAQFIAFPESCHQILLLLAVDLRARREEHSGRLRFVTDGSWLLLSLDHVTVVCLESREIERNLSGRGAILRFSFVVDHLE